MTNNVDVQKEGGKGSDGNGMGKGVPSMYGATAFCLAGRVRIENSPQKKAKKNNNKRHHVICAEVIPQH